MSFKVSLRFLASIVLALALPIIPAQADTCGGVIRPPAPSNPQIFGKLSTQMSLRWSYYASTNRHQRNPELQPQYMVFDISVREGTPQGKIVGQDRARCCRLREEYDKQLWQTETFRNLKPATQYCFQIRSRTNFGFGCVSQSPTQWVCGITQSVAIPPPKDVPPDTCVPGYVWRAITAKDRVCVKPDVRAQVRVDNGLAAQRRLHAPKKLMACPRVGSCYDHKVPCKAGFVWREAVPGDYVCVTPATRKQAVQDNINANTRRMGREQRLQ